MRPTKPRDNDFLCQRCDVAFEAGLSDGAAVIVYPLCTVCFVQSADLYISRLCASWSALLKIIQTVRINCSSSYPSVLCFPFGERLSRSEDRHGFRWHLTSVAAGGKPKLCAFFFISCLSFYLFPGLKDCKGVRWSFFISTNDAYIKIFLPLVRVGRQTPASALYSWSGQMYVGGKSL